MVLYIIIESIVFHISLVSWKIMCLSGKRKHLAGGLITGVFATNILLFIQVI